jgi:hypothetical protein
MRFECLKALKVEAIDYKNNVYLIKNEEKFNSIICKKIKINKYLKIRTLAKVIA